MRCKTIHLGFPTSCFVEKYIFFGMFIPEFARVGGGEAINQLNMCIFWLLGGKHEQYIYIDVVKQNKTLNFVSILLRG